MVAGWSSILALRTEDFVGEDFNVVPVGRRITPTYIVGIMLRCFGYISDLWSEMFAMFASWNICCGRCLLLHIPSDVLAICHLFSLTSPHTLTFLRFPNVSLCLDWSPENP